MTNKFSANIFIKGKIECLTGLYIGGSKDKFEIGGVDNPVHRDPLSRYPYIPGSSLKGKLRMLLEYSLGVVDAKEGAPSTAKEITNLFGIGAGKAETSQGETQRSSVIDQKKENIKSGSVSLIVRDAYPDADTVKKWETLDSELLYTEYKPENTIDRITSEANPRTMERVVKGSFFDFEIILAVYEDIFVSEIENAEYIAQLKNIQTAMMLLEHSTLGGSGSRGYGKIKFHVIKPIMVKCEDYVGNNEKYKLASKTVDDIKNTSTLKALSDIDFSNELINELELSGE
jgi:CRISPR-associated protein Csm3